MRYACVFYDSNLYLCISTFGWGRLGSQREVLCFFLTPNLSYIIYYTICIISIKGFLCAKDELSATKTRHQMRNKKTQASNKIQLQQKEKTTREVSLLRFWVSLLSSKFGKWIRTTSRGKVSSEAILCRKKTYDSTSKGHSLWVNFKTVHFRNFHSGKFKYPLLHVKDGILVSNDSGGSRLSKKKTLLSMS